jgi:hypothetical protein
VNTRNGKRGSRKLFGVETEWRLLRRVATDRQSACHSLGSEFVSETCVVFEIHLDGFCHETLRVSGHDFVKDGLRPPMSEKVGLRPPMSGKA